MPRKQSKTKGGADPSDPSVYVPGSVHFVINRPEQYYSYSNKLGVVFKNAKIMYNARAIYDNIDHLCMMYKNKTSTTKISTRWGEVFSLKQKVGRYDDGKFINTTNKSFDFNSFIATFQSYITDPVITPTSIYTQTREREQLTQDYEIDLYVAIRESMEKIKDLMNLTPEESERLVSERLASEKVEKERLEEERLEKERLENERKLERERLESERLERERPYSVQGGRKCLDDCTVAELKARAAKRGVSLAGLTKKAEIIAKLRKGKK